MIMPGYLSCGPKFTASLKSQPVYARSGDRVSLLLDALGALVVLTLPSEGPVQVGRGSVAQKPRARKSHIYFVFKAKDHCQLC